MAEYTLSNSAAVIDSAITRVALADTTPTVNSQSMVTSGGVKAALDNITIAKETSINGITNTDSAVPTSAAVLDANQFSLKSGYTLLHDTFDSDTKSGVAPSSGFLVIEYQMIGTAGNDNIVTVGGQSFNMNNHYRAGNSNPVTAYGVFTLPIAHNEAYSVYIPYTYSKFTVYFKSFRTA